MAFVLESQGEPVAWRNRCRESPEQFKAVQKIWPCFGWGMVLGGMLGMLCLAGLLGAVARGRPEAANMEL